MTFLLATGLATAAMLSPMDTRYLKNAAEADIAEIGLSKLSLKKTKNPAVRGALQMMINDHSAHLDQVRAVGRRLHVQLPTMPNAKDQAAYDRFANKAGGKSYDRMLASSELRDHIMNVTASRQEARNGRSMPVRQLAKNTLPTLLKHEQMWRGVVHKVGGSSR